MKQLLIILITLLSFQASGQIYVDSPNDIRFVRYRDSLSVHLKEVKRVLSIAKEIRYIKSYAEYQSFCKRNKMGRSIGRGHFHKIGDDKPYFIGTASWDSLVKKSDKLFILSHYTENFWWCFCKTEPKVKVYVRHAPEPEIKSDSQQKYSGLTVINRIETAYGKTITIDSIKVR